MDFKKLCHARYSVRAYKPDAIPAEKMEYIKECTRLAPSAVNKQPWKFFLFTREEDRSRMQQCYDRDWFREAPAYVLASPASPRPGHATKTARATPTSTWPSPSNTFAWPPPNKAWAPAGYATSTWNAAASCSGCQTGYVPWPSSR